MSVDGIFAQGSISSHNLMWWSRDTGFSPQGQLWECPRPQSVNSFEEWHSTDNKTKIWMKFLSPSKFNRIIFFNLVDSNIKLWYLKHDCAIYLKYHWKDLKNVLSHHPFKSLNCLQNNHTLILCNTIYFSLTRITTQTTNISSLSRN